MSSRVARREKLKELREARKNGARIIADDEDEEIYDEVDEETYRQHKRDQLMNDDFIVDDDGEGYVDNGVDEWDDSTRPNYYSDEEESHNSKKRSRKEKPIKVAKTAQINNFFKPSTNSASSKVIDTNIDDILDNFDDAAPVKKQKRENFFGNKVANSKNKSVKKAAFNFSTSIKREKSSSVLSDSNDTVDTSMAIHDQPSSPIKRLDSEPNEIEKEGKENIDPKMENNDFKIKSESKSDESDSEDEIVVTRRPRAAGPSRTNIATISSVKQELGSSSPLKSSYQPQSQISHTEKLDPSKFTETSDDSSNSFKMFWLDYCEVDSSLLLFGKVLTSEGKLVSGVVQVNGLCREIYFLPREYRTVDGVEDKSQPVTAMDVHEEVSPLIMDKYNLDHIKAKPETMKYAFELPGVPRETEYLKLLLPFKTPANRNLILPSSLEGETFRHLFGANSKLFESFVLQRNIMGPCWLNISGGDFNAIQNTSHCQVEVAVDSPSSVKPITANAPPVPDLTVSSISVQTMMDPKKSKQEIVSISIATYYNLPQDAPIDENLQPNELITLVRPIGSSMSSLPPGLEALAQKQNFNLKICPNEKVLLNAVSAIVKRCDPDIFIGHKLEDISLEVLVQRMYDLKVMTWSTVGRRNRKVWPEDFARSNGNKAYQIRQIFQGRLLCDIANELGQSLTPKCLTWELPEMYELVCKKQLNPLEINFANPKYTEDVNMMLMALNENARQVLCTAEVSFSLQILSLSKQLTNIAGNAWAHTLGGTRAGRNEFILLHEFKRNNFIVPDKENPYKKNQEDGPKSKKPKYQGGLVFEPEKGLHKNYILVMDFNSLYPSIIQEYNICFTTVDRDEYNRNNGEKDIPVHIPDANASMGVLPRLLNTLVSRRREVKKLLKDPKNTPFQSAQYDIKQQALKLTANSMYGCLGFEHSRFFARPLASLVTNKGREILMDTRQLAESIGLKVVYGDTDSVMIDTGADNYEEAIKLGEAFKIQVNERYKLLEIDIDNTFKRLLLHAKKKYAALNVSFNKATKEETTTLEIKGLDMRRREYCQLSKDISMFVLNKLLSDLDPDEAMNDICQYLESTSKQIKANEINIDKFRISTKLSKDPKDYAKSGSNMPAVQVALRLRAEGKVVKKNNVMSFVITLPANEQEEGLAPALRAKPMQEVMRNRDTLKPDPEYYLEKQIIGPIQRLVEQVEGADVSRIAQALGIDVRKFVARENTGTGNAYVPLESNISDAERFKNSSYFALSCNCGNKFRFGGILASHNYKLTYNGITCLKCQNTFSTLKITSQLEKAIRNHIALYYAGWLACDDAACGVVTRQVSVYGKRCIGASGTAHGCKGIMSFKYSDKALYNQLLYFNAIFDVDKAKENKLRPIYSSLDNEKAPADMAQGEISALVEQNRELFGICQGVVQKYLGDCGRRYVNMKSIFEFMV